MSQINIFSAWDAEASVWVVLNSDVPGLATEAPTLDELVKKLKCMIPELLELNGRTHDREIPFKLVSEVEELAYC